MQTARCQSVKESILRFLLESTVIEEMGDLCVATLPIPTVDGRLVDVFIEKKIGDYLLVHDGSKAANELIIQGIDITEAIDRSCEQLADKFGVLWDDETFQANCKQEGLNRAIMGVAACSSLATFHLVGHKVAAEENPVRDQFGAVLRKWAKKRAIVREHVLVDGFATQHSFDFVVTSKSQENPIAVSVLMPTGSSRSAAERFGFKIGDIQRRGDAAAGWKRLVVEARSEVWSEAARNIIGQYADRVIPIGVDRKPAQSQVAEAMEALA